MSIKTHEIPHAEILHLEGEMNNLWGELNTVNISHTLRIELEEKLSRCEEFFKAVLEGEAPINELEKNIKHCDLTLAFAVIQQAQNEISKIEKTSSSYLALENIRREMSDGKLTPIKARHQVKEIMRRHK